MGKYRIFWLSGAESSEKAVLGLESLRGSRWTTDPVWMLRALTTSGGPKWDRPHVCEFNSRNPANSWWSRHPYTSARGLEERNNSKHTTPACCRKDLPSGETTYPMSHLQRVYQKWVHLWVENQPLQLPLAFHGERRSSKVSPLQPGRKASPRSKAKFESKHTRPTFLPVPTTIVKGHSHQFCLARISYWLFNHKITKCNNSWNVLEWSG